MQLVKILGALLILLAPLSSFASLITITNADFEDQTLVLNQSGGTLGPWTTSAIGWTVANGGTFAPTNEVYAAGQADGRVGWSNGGSLWQLTSANFEAGFNYTLSVDIGDRIGTNFPAGRIILFAGNISNLIASLDLLAPADGTFETRTVSASEVDFSDFIGQAIGVLLVSDGAQINFDNVSVSATPVSAPGTLAMFALSMVLLGFTKRKRS